MSRNEFTDAEIILDAIESTAFGMRDRFACAALCQLMRWMKGPNDTKLLCARAYAIADAMIEARKNKETP